MKDIRVNVLSVANSKKIRHEVRNGRQLIIVPSATLPDNIIMNRIHYPADVIAEGYKTLERTPAPLGHPKVNGVYVNASDPEAINGYWVGAWNENVRREGGRVHLDKVIDVERAKSTEQGVRLLEAINNQLPIHTSTGLFLSVKDAKHDDYDHVATKMIADHDCFLLDEQGAATPDQGVGVYVNSSGGEMEIVSCNVADAVMTPEASNDSKRRRLRDALAGDWLVDFSDDRVIYEDRQTEKPMSREYTDDGTTITFTSEPEPVTRQTSWIKSLPVVNTLLRLLNSGAKDPEKSSDSEVHMDKTELEAILAANAEATATAIAEAIKPLAEAVESVTETMTANQRSAEQAKRNEVEKVLGKAAADALTGNALDEAYAKLVDGKAGALATNSGNAPEGRDAYNTAPEE